MHVQKDIDKGLEATGTCFRQVNLGVFDGGDGGMRDEASRDGSPLPQAWYQVKRS